MTDEFPVPELRVVADPPVTEADLASEIVAPTRAHEIVIRERLKVWTHRGSEGVNVFDEALAEQLREAGCNVRAYSPEAIGNPSRTAWEVVLPVPTPLEAVADGME